MTTESRAGNPPGVYILSQGSTFVDCGNSLDVTSTEPIISPINNDGNFDTTTIDITSSSTVDRWFFTIKNDSGTVVYDWNAIGNHSFVWNDTSLPDGNYTATVEGSGETATTSIIIDNTPPEFTSVEVVDNLLGFGLLTIKIQDPKVNNSNSGLKELTVNGVTESISGDEYTYSELLPLNIALAIKEAYDNDFSTLSLSGGDFNIKQSAPSLPPRSFDLAANKAVKKSTGGNLFIPGKSCYLKGPTGSRYKILFFGAYDFHRGLDKDTRDVTLAFKILKYNKQGYYAKTEFLRKIDIRTSVPKNKKSISLNQPIKNGSLIDVREESINPSQSPYKEKLLLDELTDAVYNNDNTFHDSVPHHSDLPGMKKKLEPKSSIVFVSANLSKLKKSLTQDIVITFESTKKPKSKFSTKLRVMPANNGKDNWSKIDCIID